MILWIKALHVIFVITWFAGLFYLPRLFVYHAMSRDSLSIDRFKIMERKLYRGIMMPSGVLATVFGVWLLYAYGWAAYKTMGWLHAKLAVVVLLWVYHLYCGKLRHDFAADRNVRSHTWYRWFNEVPVVFLFAIVIFVIVKPF